MRKIILFICSLVLLILPVLASPSVSSIYSEVSPNPVVLGQPFTIKTTVYYTENGNIFTMPNSPGEHVYYHIVDVDYGYGYVYTYNGVATKNIFDYPISRYPVGTHTVLVHVYHNGNYLCDGDPISFEVIPQKQEIPEFPNLAVPIIVIFGLVFVVGRKKI